MTTTKEPVIPGQHAVNGTFYVYGLFMESLLEGLFDFESDVFFMMLTDPGYGPNINTHKYKTSISNELGPTYSGYSPGGKQLPISTISYTGSTKTITINASNLQWPLVTFPSPGARYGVIYDSVTKDGSGTPSAMPLVGYVDFIAPQIITDMAFNVNWPSTGMFNLNIP